MIESTRSTQQTLSPHVPPARPVTSICVAALGLLVTPSIAQQRDSIEGIAGEYWEGRMAHYPTSATSIGDHRYNDQLDDLSQRARDDWMETIESLRERARRVSVRRLSDDQRLDRRLLIRTLKDEATRIRCMGHLLPMDPLYGMHVRLPLLLTSQPFNNAADFDDYVKRLRAFPAQVSYTIKAMRDGMAQKWVSPRVIVQKTVPQIKAHIVTDVTSSEFYAPARRLTNLSQADQERIRADLVDAIQGDVIPAYLQLLAFVEDVYLPRTRSTIGLGSLHAGDHIYKALTRLHTTMKVSPEEVHQIGLAEVARIKNEMSKIAKEMAFDGTVGEFLKQTREDKRNRFTSREELFAAADTLLQRAKKQMPQLFGRLPQADCVMKEMEPFRAASAPMAYYGPSPEDGSRPGYYYINTYKPEDRLRYTLEALTYHEAVPGHHHQMALDQENQSLPKFRRYASFTAYVEGWALYSEKLGHEIGGYGDPLSRLGQLTFEMWRASRLVVDTGIHLKGWSRDQAIEYMMAQTGMTRLDMVAEVDRYIAWPGQALAYKMGELRFVAMRRAAESKLKERFDLCEFHDQLLSGGAMPIDMLEERMNAWLKAQ